MFDTHDASITSNASKDRPDERSDDAAHVVDAAANDSRRITLDQLAGHTARQSCRGECHSRNVAVGARTGHSAGEDPRPHRR